MSHGDWITNREPRRVKVLNWLLGYAFVLNITIVRSSVTGMGVCRHMQKLVQSHQYVLQTHTCLCSSIRTYCRPIHVCAAPSVRTAGPCMFVQPHQYVLQGHACLCSPISTYCRDMHVCAAPSVRTKNNTPAPVHCYQYVQQPHADACSFASVHTVAPCRDMVCPIGRLDPFRTYRVHVQYFLLTIRLNTIINVNNNEEFSFRPA